MAQARAECEALGIRWGAIGLTSGGNDTATFGFVGGPRAAAPHEELHVAVLAGQRARGCGQDVQPDVARTVRDAPMR